MVGWKTAGDNTFGIDEGVSSGKRGVSPLLPDLDGEIYLKVRLPINLNTDGTVNILDRIIISQGFGGSSDACRCRDDATAKI